MRQGGDFVIFFSNISEQNVMLINGKRKCNQSNWLTLINRTCSETILCSIVYSFVYLFVPYFSSPDYGLAKPQARPTLVNFETYSR